MKNQRILIIGIVLLTLITACSNSTPAQPTDMPADELPTQIPPTPLPPADSVGPVLVPEENTIYLGIYNWQPVVFWTGLNGKSHSDFYTLENPQAVFVSDEEIFRIDDFELVFLDNNGETSSTLYLLLSLNTDEDYGINEQRLIEVNLNTLESNVRWAYLIDEGYKYADYFGLAKFYQIDDDPIIILNVFKCDGCDINFSSHPAKLLVNIQTGEEKFLGSVEDIYINFFDNTVNYREVENFSFPCEDVTLRGSCPYFRGVGDFISEELP